MGDIGRRQVRFDVLPLAGGDRRSRQDVEDDDAAWAFGAGSDPADVDIADSAPVDQRPGARTEPARS